MKEFLEVLQFLKLIGPNTIKSGMIGMQVRDLRTGDGDTLFRQYSHDNLKKLGEQARPGFFASIWNRLLGFGTSPSVGRLIAIASVASILVYPGSMLLAVLAAAAVCISIAVSVCVEAKRLSRLRVLQVEDKMLNEIVNLNREHARLLKALPSESRELLKREIYAVKGIEEQAEKYHFKWYKTTYRGVVGRLPENTAGFIASLATFSPVAFMLNMVSTFLNYGQNIKTQVAFDSQKNELLNDMATVKHELGLVYPRGQGLPLLQDLKRVKVAEKYALQDLASYLVKEPLSAVEAASKFQEMRDKHLAANLRQPNKYGVDENPSFYSCLSKVVFGGFSSSSTVKAFAPLAFHMPLADSNAHNPKTGKGTVKVPSKSLSKAELRDKEGAPKRWLNLEQRLNAKRAREEEVERPIVKYADLKEHAPKREEEALKGAAPETKNRNIAGREMHAFEPKVLEKDGKTEEKRANFVQSLKKEKRELLSDIRPKESIFKGPQRAAPERPSTRERARGS